MLGGHQARRDGDFKEMPVRVALTATALTYKMKVSDYVVYATSATGGDDTGIVYLPPLAESIGRMYCVVAPTGSTGNDISLYSIEAGGSDLFDLDADGDAIVLYSTGAEWLTVISGIA